MTPLNLNDRTFDYLSDLYWLTWNRIVELDEDDPAADSPDGLLLTEHFEIIDMIGPHTNGLALEDYSAYCFWLEEAPQFDPSDPFPPLRLVPPSRKKTSK